MATALLGLPSEVSVDTPRSLIVKPFLWKVEISGNSLEIAPRVVLPAVTEPLVIVTLLKSTTLLLPDEISCVSEVAAETESVSGG